MAILIGMMNTGRIVSRRTNAYIMATKSSAFIPKELNDARKIQRIVRMKKKSLREC